MELLPKSHEDFSHSEYWDAFFTKRGLKAFEWYGEYPELYELINKYSKDKDDILVIGCGNSKLSMDMYDDNYKKITNIDISKVVIRQMKQQNKDKRPNLIYEEMDVLNMSFSDESFSVIIDKGTLDALMPNSDPEVQERVDKMFKEIQRVLKISGRYICISLLQEHILQKLLDYFPKNNWIFRINRCHQVEQKNQDENENSLPVFMVICTKFKQLTNPIFEAGLVGTSLIRCNDATTLMGIIKSVQQAAMVCSRLRTTDTNVELGEVTLDICDSSNNLRYTIYIVQQKRKKELNHYAGFIVPLGRETEWIFSTKHGRRHLLTTTQYSRLAVVTMHRGQIYINLDAVKYELNNVILNLAPPLCRGSSKQNIPFLSIGKDLGKREIRYEGTSSYSGKFIVEDVTISESDVCRRLIFLNNQNVIQSETKLKKIRSRHGVNYHPDPNYLTCQHHIFMSLGVTLVASLNEISSTLLIGLGGGGLCGWMSRTIPKLRITAVDIDDEIVNVAKEWFGLKSDWAEIVIDDGLHYIAKAAETGKKFNAVLFDVDSKDNSIGMSCPPKEFLEDKVLKDVKSIIDDKGLFILNLVVRDTELRSPILKRIKDFFPQVVSYLIKNELNEVMFCFSEKLAKEDIFINKLKNAAEKQNQTIKKQKIQKDNLIDLTTLMSSLRIC